MTIKSKATYHQTKDMAAANSRFGKAGVSCFYNSEVLNLIFVPLINLVLKNPHLAKRQNISLNTF
jgi:hypothetical protein